MGKGLREDAEAVARAAVAAANPAQAVRDALQGRKFPGDVYLAAVGKAAWNMARAALETVAQPVVAGVVVTKYGHVGSPLPGIACYEGGHPLPDKNGLEGTEAVWDMTARLTPTDTVLFLLSGGGSALFEMPKIPLEELRDLTDQLLRSGADITEINTIRKRLSAVKGGRFALHCAPAQVEAIVLSDVLGDPPDQIASGPVAPDPTTCAEAQAIARKYGLTCTPTADRFLAVETPKRLDNVHYRIVGSVRQLCSAAGAACTARGYRPVVLTDRMCCEAREAGNFLSGLLATQAARYPRDSVAFLAGGETTVHVRGHGLGGRNQELALAAAPGITGMENAALISIGSDGTDGPTDAAGGYVDGETMVALTRAGVDYAAAMADNDAYHALDAVGGLVKTGPTGTNVNDITVALLRGIKHEKSSMRNQYY